MRRFAFQKICAVLLLGPVLASCSTLRFWESNAEKKEDTAATPGEPKPQDSEVEPKPTDATAMDSIDLKQAKIWARLDELENMVMKQKEKIQLLERGLLLGVVPEGIRKGDEGTLLESKPKATKKPEPEIELEKAESGHPSADAKSAVKPLESDGGSKDAYMQRMVVARDLYKDGRYGKAYLEFAKIEKEFEPEVSQGEPQYWLGRCWLKLSEFQTASQTLQSFLTNHPTSPWAPSAKYFLASAEMKLGMNEAATRHLQEVIRDNPYEGSAEAAKELLARMQKNL